MADGPNDKGLNSQARIDFVLDAAGVAPGLAQIQKVLQALGGTSQETGARFKEMVNQLKLMQQQLSAVSTVSKTNAYGLAGLENKVMSQKERDQQILFSKKLADAEINDRKRVTAARNDYVKTVLEGEKVLHKSQGKRAVRSVEEKAAAKEYLALRTKEIREEFDMTLAATKTRLAAQAKMEAAAADAKQVQALNAVNRFEKELYARVQRKHREELLLIADAEKRRVAIIAAAQKEIDLITSRSGGAKSIPGGFSLGSSTSNALAEAELNLQRQYANKKVKVAVDAAAVEAENKRRADAAALEAETKQTQRLYNNLVTRIAKEERATNKSYTDAEARLAAHNRAMVELAKKGIDASRINPLASQPHLQVAIDSVPRPVTKEKMAAAAKPSGMAMAVARQEQYGGIGAQQLRVNTLAGYAGAAAVVSGITASITQVVQFEQALKNLQAISGTTNIQMASLGQTIRSVAQDFSFTAVETANAATILAQAGYKGKEIEQSLRGVLMLAQATGSQVEMSADTMTTVQAVFQRDATSSMEVANLLTAAVNKTKLGMGQIQLGLQYAGNSAADLNIPLVELVSSFGAAAQAGIKSASTIGTGTRKLLEDLAEPNEKYIERLKARGLAVEDVDIRTIGLTRTLERLKEAQFSAADAMYAFDVRGQNMYSAITGQMDLFTSLPGEISNTSAALEAQKTQMEGLSAASANLWTNLTILFERMASPSIDVLVEGVKLLASGIKTLSENSTILSGTFSVVATILIARLPMAIAGLVRNFITWTGALTAARAAVLGLNAATSTTVVTTTALGPKMATAAAATMAYARANGVAAVAARGFAGVMAGTSALLGGPFGIAIAAATAAMYFLNEESRQAELQAQASADAYSELSSKFDQQVGLLKNLSKDTLYFEDKMKRLKGETALTTSEFEDLSARYVDLDKYGITANSTLEETRKALIELRNNSLLTSDGFRKLSRYAVQASEDAINSILKLGALDKAIVIAADINRGRTGTGFGEDYQLPGGRTATRTRMSDGSSQVLLKPKAGSDEEKAVLGFRRNQIFDTQKDVSAQAIFNNPKIGNLRAKVDASSGQERQTALVALRKEVYSTAERAGVRSDPSTRSMRDPKWARGSAQYNGAVSAAAVFMSQYQDATIPLPAARSDDGRSANARAQYGAAAQGFNSAGGRETDVQRSEELTRSTGANYISAEQARMRAAGKSEAEIVNKTASIDLSIETNVTKLKERFANKAKRGRGRGDTAGNIQRGDALAAIGADRAANQAQRGAVMGSLDGNSTMEELEAASQKMQALLTEDALFAAEQVQAQFQKRHRGKLNKNDPELLEAMDSVADLTEAEREKALTDLDQRKEKLQFALQKTQADADLKRLGRSLDAILEGGAGSFDSLYSAVEENVAAQMLSLETKIRAENGVKAGEPLSPEVRAQLNELQEAARISVLQGLEAQMRSIDIEAGRSPESLKLARRGAVQSGKGASRASTADQYKYQEDVRIQTLGVVEKKLESTLEAEKRLMVQIEEANKTGKDTKQLTIDLAAATDQLNQLRIEQAALTGNLTREEIKLANSYADQIGYSLAKVLEESKTFHTSAQTIGDGVGSLFTDLKSGISESYKGLITGNKSLVESFSDLARSVANSLAQMAADILANYTMLKLVDWMFPESADPKSNRGKIGSIIRATPGFPKKGTETGVGGFMQRGEGQPSNEVQKVTENWVSKLFKNVFDKSEGSGGLLSKIGSFVSDFFGSIFGKSGKAGGGGGGGGSGELVGNLIRIGASFFGFGFSEGGYIHGQKNNQDRVRLRASGGEYMIRSSAVDSIGVDNLNKMNKLGAEGVPKIPVRVSVPAVVSEFSSARRTELQNIPRQGPSNLEQKIYMVDDREKVPSLGPNDVVAIVMENARSRGPILQMVKAVANGSAG